MVRIHIVTEGPTEKNFIDDLLKPHLAKQNIFVDAHSITTRRDRRRNKIFRGGLDNLDHLLKDLKLWLLESQNQHDCWVSMMVDLYSFPYTDKSNWIKEFESKPSGLEKAIFLETELAKEFSNFNRFIPYIQLHEYEALLLSKTSEIHNAFNHYPPNNLRLLNAELHGLSPEQINQGQHSAPSKRIIKYYPEYDDNKPVWGSLIAQEIGINHLRQHCPHFDEWLVKLESLNTIS